MAISVATGASCASRKRSDTHAWSSGRGWRFGPYRVFWQSLYSRSIWISIWAPFAYAEPSSARKSPLIELSITSRAHSPSFPAPAVALNRPLALVSRCALAIKPRHTSADLEPDTCHGSLTRVTHHSSSRASEREALHRHRLRPPRSSCPAQAHRGHAARPPRQRPSLAARAEQ